MYNPNEGKGEAGDERNIIKSLCNNGNNHFIPPAEVGRRGYKGGKFEI